MLNGSPPRARLSTRAHHGLASVWTHDVVIACVTHGSFLVQPTLLGRWADMAFLEIVRMLDVDHDGRVSVEELMALDLDHDGRCVACVQCGWALHRD